MAFATVMPEEWSVFRGAIECAVHAHKLYRQPELTSVWLGKSDDKVALKTYRTAFEHKKKENLFPANLRFLADLYEWWQQYSELGPHAGLASISLRAQKTSETGWTFNYFEIDARRLVPFVDVLLNCSWLIENTFYDIFSDRLKLDPKLMELRTRFEHEGLRIADEIARALDLKR